MKLFIRSRSSQLSFNYKIMDLKFKYGLKHASSFLKEFRELKSNQQDYDQQTVHERTFQQEEISLPKNSPVNLQKQQSITHQYSPIDNSPIKASQMIMLNHLKQTYTLYKSDLQQLQQNRDNLSQAIQKLAQKIAGIPQLHTKNQNLQLDNYRQRKDIEQMIKEYHLKKIQLKARQNKAQTNLIKKKQKLKKLLDLIQCRVQNRVQIESWDQYNYQLEINQWQAKESVKKNNGPYQQQIENDIIDRILYKKIEKRVQKISKTKIQQQQEQELPFKPKSRDGLLGDLKSFSKNFKMP